MMKADVITKSSQMHELSLCRNILAIIHQHVSTDNQKKIKKIGLEVGQLAAVDQSALQFAFDVIKKGTIAEEAILTIMTIDAEGLCESCGQKTKIKQYADPCEHCGRYGLIISTGEELSLKFLEIE